jgi:serpin B
MKWPAVIQRILSRLTGARGVSPVPKPSRVADYEEVLALTKENSTFAIALYQKLSSQEGNLFFSPYSISIAVAMLYAGARGETAKEMAKTLHFSLPPEQLHSAFAALQLGLLPKEKDFQLAIANQLWGQKGVPISSGFLSLLRENYDAALSLLDFSQGVVAANAINQWVKKQSRGLIQDIVTPSAFHALTRLVITNAIYFKASWEHTFKESQTKPKPFYLNATETVEAPMMFQVRRYHYAENPDVQLVRLPYVGPMEMLVLLPKKVDGLAKLEEGLSAESIEGLLSTTRQYKVKLSLPRFKMSSTFSLSGTLASLGMPLAFREEANFSGISKQQALFLSDVVHKAFIDVNETSTEAAAVTMVLAKLRSAPPEEIIIFQADHPFLFMIRDQSSKAILFLGRLENPLHSAVRLLGSPSKKEESHES